MPMLFMPGRGCPAGPAGRTRFKSSSIRRDWSSIWARNDAASRAWPRGTRIRCLRFAGSAMRVLRGVRGGGDGGRRGGRGGVGGGGGWGGRGGGAGGRGGGGGGGGGGAPGAGGGGRGRATL